jgi:hypothetical protein
VTPCARSALGHRGESLRGPLLPRPTAGGGEHDVAGEAAGCGEAIRGGGHVEPHLVGAATGVEPEGFDEGEHAVDGVDLDGCGDARGVGDGCALACIGVTDAHPSPRGPREESAAGEALAIEHEVVAWLLERGEEARDRGEVERTRPATEAGARELEDVRERGVRDDDVGEGVLDEPVDSSVREGGTERNQHGHRTRDVPQGTRADDEDAFGGRASEGRIASPLPRS